MLNKKKLALVKRLKKLSPFKPGSCYSDLFLNEKVEAKKQKMTEKNIKERESEAPNISL